MMNQRVLFHSIPVSPYRKTGRAIRQVASPTASLSGGKDSSAYPATVLRNDHIQVLRVEAYTRPARFQEGQVISPASPDFEFMTL
jgi:hypothetical protein